MYRYNQQTLETYTTESQDEIAATSFRRTRAHEALPVPMLLPDEVHEADVHAFSLRHEQEREQLHDGHPGREEEEDAPLHGAQAGEKELGHQECEEHVDRHGDALPRRPRVHVQNLARE